MNRNSIFRSEIGKEKIRDYYLNILQYFPLKQRMLNTFAGDTFVLEAGKEGNPTLVLIHGSCSNSSAWLGDIGAFVEHYHVYALDVPGEPGNSAEYRMDVNSEEYSEWLKEVLDQISMDPVILIGNSMGGWIAAHFAAKYPERVRSLILVAASGIVVPNTEFMEQVTKIEEQEDSSKDVAKTVLNDAELPSEVMEFMMLIMDYFIPVTEALSVLTDAELQHLSMPVLWVAGKQDITMNSVQAANRLQKWIPNLEVRLIEGTHVITTVQEYVIPFLFGKI